MLSKRHFQYIFFLSFFIFLINYLLFGNLSVDFIFLFGNFIVVILSLFLINYCQLTYLRLNEKIFIKRIFLFSLWLTIFAVLFYYALFYYITGTEFDVEPLDAIPYDAMAQQTAASFHNGTFSIVNLLIQVKGSFDDTGYIMFLSLIYSFFNNSIIIARLIQAIISALTVILIYKVGKNVFDDKTGKLSAILTATFQPFLLYASIHMKETIMIYFLFLFIHQCIKIHNKKINVGSIIILIFSLVALFSCRTVLGLIAFVSFLGYLLIAAKYSVAKKMIILLSMGTIVFFLIINLPAFSDIADKAERYAGMDTGAQGTLGGKTADQVASGQSLMKYAGGGVLLLQSIVMPYPSTVRTNIVFYDQTLQWYYAGGLLIWAFLSYYAYIGLYYSIKNKFKQSSILIFIIAIYTIALISSLYITSIRFNIVKIALLMPFIAFGVVSANKRANNNFIKYAVVVSIIVLIWNYVKLSGRGLA
jgi:hypothetical protein